MVALKIGLESRQIVSDRILTIRIDVVIAGNATKN
jgi:hypothetical protein